MVHRFTRQTENSDGLTATVPDTDYAQLTVSMRTADRLAAVFDALHSRGQIRLHASEAERHAAIAGIVAAEHTTGQPVAVVVDTREQVSGLNAAIRDRLIATGMVDDTRVATTGAGQRIGVGDQVATRRNDRDLDVANRDTWTVTHTHRDGRLTVTSPTAGQRVLPAGYVGAHVELAYATTAHGAQGATATTAHLVLGEHTGAASAYVGMTRGRQANTAHLIAANPDEAREQWVTAFARDRADLGPDHARRDADRAAAGYARPRPVGDLIAALRQEWDREARDVDILAQSVPLRDDLRQITQLRRQQLLEIEPVEGRYEQARDTRSLARARAEHSETVVAAETEQHRDALLADWNTQRPAAHAYAGTVLDGPGRLGLKLPAVNRANEALACWAIEWQPIIPVVPTEHSAIARFADRADDTPRIHAALEDHARRQAAVRHPESERHVAGAAAADHDVIDARVELSAIRDRHQRELAYYGRLGHAEAPHQQLAQIEQCIATTEQRLAETRAQIARLGHGLMAAADGGGQAGPVRVDASRHGQPADSVTAARSHWFAERDAEQHAAQLKGAHRVAIADSAWPPRESPETWRRHGHGLNSPTPEDGIER